MLGNGRVPIQTDMIKKFKFIHDNFYQQIDKNTLKNNCNISNNYDTKLIADHEKKYHSESYQHM